MKKTRRPYLFFIYIALFLVFGNPLADVYRESPSILGAAIHNDMNMVAYYLDQNGDINVTDRYGRTALMWAADRGHSDMVKYLLSRGADPDAETDSGVRAVDMALTQEIADSIHSASKEKSNKRSKPTRRHRAALRGKCRVRASQLNRYV